MGCPDDKANLTTSVERTVRIGLRADESGSVEEYLPPVSPGLGLGKCPGRWHRRRSNMGGSARRGVSNSGKPSSSSVRHRLGQALAPSPPDCSRVRVGWWLALVNGCPAHRVPRLRTPQIEQGLSTTTSVEDPDLRCRNVHTSQC